MRNNILILLTIFITGCFSFFYLNTSSAGECGAYKIAEISIVNTTIRADVADNECKRTLGLSGRDPMGKGEGMLFKYDSEGARGIWMKDMKFPIDILWMNKDMAIVGIGQNVVPETYPKIFGEEYPANYVLEVPAGFAVKNHIVLGGIISIE